MANGAFFPEAGEVDPCDEDELQGETGPEEPVGEAVGCAALQCHVDVGGEDSDEERDEAPCGEGAQWLDEDADAAGDFGCAADPVCGDGMREPWGHDGEIGCGVDEMIRAGEEEEDAECVAEEHGEKYKV